MNIEFLALKSPEEFLKAAQSLRRQSPLSIRQLSQKLGYASDRGVGMTLKGQRAMSFEMQARLVKFLKLTSKEQLHLQGLMRKNEDTPLKGAPKCKTTLLPAEKLHPFVRPYALAILELLRVADRPLRASVIQKKLKQKTDLKELTLQLETLEHSGLIKKDDQGAVRALGEDEYVCSSLETPSNVIRQIHRAQLMRASEVLEEQPLSDREFISKTLSIPKDRLPEIKRRIRECIEELSDEIEGGDNLDESLCIQLNLQFFRQT